MLRFFVIFVLIAIGLIVNLVELIPEVYATHNANLFVSAENSNFNNYFGGPMVIQVVISDPSIASLSDAHGEPDVTVNGKKLRMVQTIDGNWYGYFADRNMTEIADSTTSIAHVGLDFGTFCANDDGDDILGFGVTDTVGFVIPRNVAGGTQGQTSISSEQCSGGIDTNLQNNVVRESKTINTASPSIGQIGFTSYNLAWPFIQLYNFNPTGNVVIQYNKGGEVQKTTLTFDTVEQFANTQIDRTQYPRDSEVHLTVTDAQLNIDPTDEDSWTWDTSNDDTLHTLYQLFDENGNQAADGMSANAFDINPHLTDLMFEGNGVLILNVNSQGVLVNVLTLVDNAEQQYVDGTGNTAKNTQLASDVRTKGGTLGPDTQPVTLTEQGSNSGIFGSYDHNGKSNIKITDNAIRGSSAIIDYNETPKTILVGFGFATINMDETTVGGEWNSGEEIQITLTDSDANKNSKLDEDLDVSNPNVPSVPTLVTGSPFTLEGLSTAKAITNVNAFFTIDIQPISQRVILTSPGIVPSGTFALELSLGNTYSDLYNHINDPENSFHGFNFFNYDVRSINAGMTGGSVTSVDIILDDPIGGESVILANNAPLKGFINLADATGNPFSLTRTQNVVIRFTFDVNGTPQITSGTKMPIVVDFFSYGFLNEGVQKQQRIANQIIRLELEETGNNTGVFTGSLKYLMLNQLNILNPLTYENLSTIAGDPTFIVIEDLTDEDSLRVNYFDLAADGTNIQISDQQQVSTHSGTVSFDKENYDAGQLVTITLNDQDLNVDSNLIDIYTVVDLPHDIAFDTIGMPTLPVFSFGPMGRMLEITFDDSTWSSGLAINSGICNAAGIPDDGLRQTGFSLVETGASSGIFTGNFNIPQNFCNSVTGLITDVNGKEMKVSYVDFRNSFGDITLVSDSATIGPPQGLIQWRFDDIAGKTLDLPNNNGTIIMPENLDIYFSTVNKIQEKVAATIPQDRYDIQTRAYYDGKDLTLTKTITVIITNHKEFVSVFENDRTSLDRLLQINGTIIDENYVTKKINSLLQSCIQGVQPNAYCNKTPEELKRLILEKIGTHTINESIILNRIVTNSKINTIEVQPHSTTSPTIHNEFGNNINHIVSSFSSHIFHVGKSAAKSSLLPEAVAQTDDPQNGESGVYARTFLNGFTIGYGFEKNWSYEFNVLGSMPIYAEAHIENGLGIGFRIPIVATLRIDPISLRLASTDDSKFGLEYTITTKDLNDKQYLELGLPSGQEFNGKEFKIYLGPRASILIKLFDETLVDKEMAVIEEVPEEKDFTPPLNNLEPPLEITSYTVDCNITKTCLDTPIGTIGLVSGVKASISGEKVTINSNPITATIKHQDLTFNKNSEPIRYNYDVPKDIDSQSQDPVSFGTMLQDAKYYSSLYFIPRIKLEAELTSWILPFSISSEWVNFPEIQFNNVVFEKHENTINVFKIDNGKIYLHSTTTEGVTTTPTKSTCGPDEILIEGECMPIEEETPQEENADQQKNGGGCLIATATFGSELAQQVQFLREIRDNTVLSTQSGASFMTAFNAFYYSFSPTVADWERQNSVFKEMVKVAITPLLASLSLLQYVDIGSESEMLGYGIGIILLNIVMYMIMPAVVILQFKKRL